MCRLVEIQVILILTLKSIKMKTLKLKMYFFFLLSKLVSIFSRKYLTKKDIISLQKEIQKNIKNLNSGGCGKFVLLCNETIKHRFLLFESFAGHYGSVKENISNNIGCNHHFILTEHGFWDGYKFIDIKTYDFVDVYPIYILKQCSNWNTAFDISQLDKLKNIIKKYE